MSIYRNADHEKMLIFICYCVNNIMHVMHTGGLQSASDINTVTANRLLFLQFCLLVIK